MVEVEFKMSEKEFRENFLISGIRDEEMILGLPWLRFHNSRIDWETGEMEFSPRQKIQIKQFMGILDNTPEEVLIRAKTTTLQELAQQTEGAKKSIDKLIPSYLQGYQKWFKKGKSECFPPSRTYNHRIELKPDFIPWNCKLYSLRPAEQKEQDKFLEENMWKEYIRKSKSPIALPFFFVAKKEKEALRPTQDYWELNKRTIKNAYPLLFISELLDKLKGANIFSKLNLQNSYNNVQIKDRDQWKATFKTNRGLFKPMVMFFGLSNSPATFQAFMNDILSDFINEGWCVVYMDDILLFLDNRKEH
ncbi:reverse transcriptase-rnase h-integrase [Moniliophthora roreri MCA 2997]|uniref:Reverse transcriptase-rnase h-integrase n=2 Tax=Moniliophthora roreri TaxID=221103 RepID=V2YA88_MONRO|nr:reverse transcriptase-rnase h-integrase [Moniliophthora roreri MCA 2997]